MGRLWSSLILRCRLQDVRLNTFLRLLGQVGEMGPPVDGGPWAAKEAALFSAAPRPAEEGTACVVVRRPKFRAGRLSQYMTKPGLVSRAFLFLRYDHYLGLPNRALHPTGPSTTIRAKHTLALRVGAAVGFVSFSGWLPAAFHGRRHQCHWCLSRRQGRVRFCGGLFAAFAGPIKLELSPMLGCREMFCQPLASLHT